MEITTQEAQAALSDIQTMAARTRHGLAARGAAGYLMLWGLVWIVAFAACQFAPAFSGLIWLVCDTGGVAGSVLLSVRTRRRGPIRYPFDRQLAWRIFWSCVLLNPFIAAWLTILPPTSGRQVGAFLATIAMFAYVIMGLWLECTFLVALGLGVTAWTVASFIFLPNWFNLAMAVGGGGALLVTGIYVHLRWK
jgi:hypothetical protein